MANAYLPALDDYGDAALPLDRVHRHHRMIQIRPTEGEWPDFKGRRACQDATGKWRERHAFIVEGRRGTECVHCGRLKPGKDMRLRIAG